MRHRKPYFFVGIGGSGMMPLAMILAGQGATGAGSGRSLDSGRRPPKFGHLERRGIAPPEQIGGASAAIESTVPDMVKAAELGNERMSRAELLAGLFNAAPMSV